MQQPQLLCSQLGDEKTDTRRIAAWSTETRDKTNLDRVFGSAEDDGDRRGCRFGRQRRRDDKVGKEAPIILIGHSYGADAVMPPVAAITSPSAQRYSTAVF